jgi:hypothetical protein
VHDHQDKDEQTYENHTQIKYQMQFLEKIQDEKTMGIKKLHMIFSKKNTKQFSCNLALTGPDNSQIIKQYPQ